MSLTAIPKKTTNPRLALVAGVASIATVSVLIVIKTLAYLKSGDSASVLASLVDSITDASASIMTFLAIQYSLKPADEDHRHGHGKIEGLAALLQAAVIAAAGFFLLLESLRRFSESEPVQNMGGTIVVMVISTLLSFVLIAIQKYSLRFAPSLAVEADKAHYKTDILVNAGVIGVMLALQYGAPRWVDAVFAVGVVFILGLTVRKIAGQGIDMLLDREIPGNAREVITKKVLSHAHVRGMHDLRTNKSGMKVFMSFDIELEPNLLLCHAHDIVREVEHDLLADFPNAEILIHVDPLGDKDDSRHGVAGVHK